MIERNIQKNTSGFALLLTLVVVSIVLAIGLTLLDITLKQLILSSTGRDSEIAFHTAYAGAECARYWRIQKFDEFNAGGSAPDLDSCMGVAAASMTTGYETLTSDEGDNVIYHSDYEYSWGGTSGNEDRCSEVEVYVFDASSGDATHTVADYESKVCPSGATCTIIIASGYNRPCGDIGTLQTVQREIVLEF